MPIISWTVLDLLAWGLGLRALYSLRQEFNYKAKPQFFIFWGVLSCLLMEGAMLGAQDVPALDIISALTGLSSAFFMGVGFTLLQREICGEKIKLFVRSDWDRFLAVVFVLGIGAAFLISHLSEGAARGGAHVLHIASGTIWLIISGGLSISMLTRPCSEVQNELYTPYWLSLSFAFAFFNSAVGPIARFGGFDIPKEVPAMLGTLFILSLVMTLFAMVIRIRSHKLKTAMIKIHDYQGQLASLEKVAAVGTLAAGTAHDFKNTLAIIVGQAELAIKKHDLPAGAVADLEHLQKVALSAASTVNNLMKLARPDNGVSPYDNIKEAVISPLDALSKEMKRQEINVVTHIEETPPTEVDLSLLSQVCLNLYLNARDAIKSKEGGGRLEVSIKSKNEGIRIVISDTGIGIPLAFRDKIFKAFQSTKGNQGTGLGLSVSKTVIESMGGTLEFESVEGLGTKFKIWIPMKAPSGIDQPSKNADLTAEGG